MTLNGISIKHQSTVLYSIIAIIYIKSNTDSIDKLKQFDCNNLKRQGSTWKYFLLHAIKTNFATSRNRSCSRRWNWRSLRRRNLRICNSRNLRCCSVRATLASCCWSFRLSFRFTSASLRGDTSAVLYMFQKNVSMKHISVWIKFQEAIKNLQKER